MGARKKLNEIHAIIAVVISAVLGSATSSWIVFGLGLAFLLGAKMYSGAIRTRNRRGASQVREPPNRWVRAPNRLDARPIVRAAPNSSSSPAPHEGGASRQPIVRGSVWDYN